MTGVDRMPRIACSSLIILGISYCSGCVVGQAPGMGKTLHLREASTGAGYWLYLPAEENPSANSTKAKPLVLTLHGMKPFDSAGGQIYEWQQEADRYDFVVCAPELATPWLGSPLPLDDPTTTSLLQDESNILAILNEVYRTTGVDPNSVLVTSWSYGGYIAHYLANRHPERFRALAVRQSNFSADLLDPARAPQYRNRRVGIFYTENDFATCRRESHDAAQWYAKQGFDVTFGVFAGRGHERAPSLAAAFFAKELGIEPRTPPTELATYQVREIPVSTQPAPLTTATGLARNTQVSSAPPPQPSPSPRSATEFARMPAASSSGGTHFVAPTSSPLVKIAAEPARPKSPPKSGGVSESQAAGVHVSTSIGLSPLWLNYGAIMPVTDRSAYDYSWYLNGKLLSAGANGQALITDVGDHVLEMVAKGKDGLSYKGSRTITVLPRAAKGR